MAEIVRLDRDEAAYREKLNRPVFRDKGIEEILEEAEEELLAFFAHIFDQPKAEAYRRARYGYNALMARAQERMQRSAHNWWFRKWHGLHEKWHELKRKIR